MLRLLRTCGYGSLKILKIEYVTESVAESVVESMAKIIFISSLKDLKSANKSIQKRPRRKS